MKMPPIVQCHMSDLNTAAKCGKVFCTYCSKHKNKAPGLLPALQRYCCSTRIKQLGGYAVAQNVPFFILSGKFGLVAADQEIEDYDHLLRPEEVKHLVKVVVSRFRKEKIHQLTYFTKSPEKNQEIQRYLDLIQCACTEAGVSFEVKTLDDM